MNLITIHALYAAVAPWLILSLLFIGRNPHPSLPRIVVALFVPLILLLLPVGGFSVARWIAVLEPNPSITFTILLVIALASRCGASRFFRVQDWRAAWIFGIASTLILYPMGLGLTAMDPYAWGWLPSLPVATAILAAVLLLLKNRFGFVLLTALLGMLFNPMESNNEWDHLIDPMYGTISLIMAMLTL